MKTRFFFILLFNLCCLISVSASAQKVKIACIGDSVTFGYGISQRDSLSYPGQLQVLLGDIYEVGNFGHSGATLLKNGHNPFSRTVAYQEALAFKADIAIIHLGLNDTDPRNWPYHKDEFEADYASLIEDLQRENPNIRILIAELTPIFSGHPRFKSGTRDWHQEIRGKIQKIAKDNGVELIDFYLPLHQHPDLFPDNLHPTAEGAGILAQLVYSKLTNETFEFQLDGFFQNGAVLQSGEKIKVFGKGIPGKEVAVRIEDSNAKSLVDADGDWAVELEQVPVGGAFELEVRHAKEALKLDSVWVGDLWLAMGQSNMDWPLSQSNGGKSLMDMGEDPFPKFYKFNPVAKMNNQAWDIPVLEAVQDLNFFEQKWLGGAALTSVSGVAYFFAKQLEASLNIPIGIVQLSLGGAPIESFIKRTSLEKDNLMVDMLADWKHSDFLMPWVRQRIKENLGDSYYGFQRHPFEPSYLFEAGIKHLKGLPFKGLIWYQGESNTHNPKLYSRLFHLFANDVREEFGENLPIYTVQLPGMSRNEWPHFREIQSKLAADMENTYMAVTIDLGDSLDVHPLDKKSVGERLANLALIYSYGNQSEDPAKIRVTSWKIENGHLGLFFNVNDSLKVGGKIQVQGFELIGPKGVRKKVIAEIKNNEIVIEIPCNFSPEAVWYGFDPFPETNLLSPSGLQIGPFRLSLN